MATRAEVQSTREAIDRLTQMVQFLMDDHSGNPEKQPITDTQPPLTPPPPHNPPPQTPPHPPPNSFGGETSSVQEASALGMASNPKRSDWNFPVLMGKTRRQGVAALSNSLRHMVLRTLSASPSQPSTWMEKPWYGSKNSRPALRSPLGLNLYAQFRSGLARAPMTTPWRHCPS